MRLLATGGSQCGFCTQGIIMRFAGERTARDVERVGRAFVPLHGLVDGPRSVGRSRTSGFCGRGGTGAVGGRRAASRRQRGAVGRRGLCRRSHADEHARGRTVAARFDGRVRRRLRAARWVVGESGARSAPQGKVQGRRTTVPVRPPLSIDASGDVALATSWVDPTYLEPDASWCNPGGEPTSPLGNGGAFGGKERSLAPTRT